MAEFFKKDVLVVTEKGAFIYNVGTNLDNPQWSMYWIDQIKVKSVVVDQINNTLFMLDESGVLKKIKIDSTVKDFNSMETVLVPTCFSLQKGAPININITKQSFVQGYLTIKCPLFVSPKTAF